MANEVKSAPSITLSNLSRVPGSRKSRVRVGRGIGSGLGKTSGRGGKGQTARSGKGRPRGFEGGQTPLVRRLPKYGFKNPFRKEYLVVGVERLGGFSDGDKVDPQVLWEKGIISKRNRLIKILGDGELSKKLIVKAHGFSKSAVQKIQQAGGAAETIPVRRNLEGSERGSN